MLIRPPQESRQAAFGSGFEKRSILRKISEMEDLPSLDISVAKILKLLENENVEMEDLVAAIERDQTLVAKLFKTINSGFYSLHEVIRSVNDAVVLFGLRNLRRMILSVSIMDFYSDDDVTEWHHSYTTSCLAARLTARRSLPNGETLSTAMLLHDIGKVVLRRFSADKYREASARAVNDGIPIFQAEEIVIGIHHANVGGMLLEKWGLPRETVMLVRQHHAREAPAEFAAETAAAVFIDWIDCRARSITSFQPPEAILKAADLDSLDPEPILDEQKVLIEHPEKAAEPESDEAW